MAEVVQKMSEEETSRIKADQEAKITEIIKLKTLLKKRKAEAIAKKKKKVEAESSTEDRVKTAMMKAVETFHALKELHEEKLQFFSDAYDARK